MSKDEMTLRDYFAAKALAAFIVHHGFFDEDQPMGATTSATDRDYDASFMAKIAYIYADEMMLAREQSYPPAPPRGRSCCGDTLTR